jgi:hypothetical protein
MRDYMNIFIKYWVFLVVFNAISIQTARTIQLDNLPLDVFYIICIEITDKDVKDFLHLSECSSKINNKCNNNNLLNKIARNISHFNFNALEDLPMGLRIGCLYIYKSRSKNINKYTSINLTNDGEIYVCGENRSGNLGLGHNERVRAPTLLDGDIKNEKIVFILRDEYNNFALSDGGKIYSWSGECWQRPLGYIDFSNEHYRKPKLIKALKNKRIVMVYKIAPEAFCAVTVEGKKYIWGENPHWKEDGWPWHTVIYPHRLGANFFQLLWDNTYSYFSNQSIYVLSMAVGFLIERLPLPQIHTPWRPGK